MGSENGLSGADRQLDSQLGRAGISSRIHLSLESGPVPAAVPGPIGESAHHGHTFPVAASPADRPEIPTCPRGAVTGCANSSWPRHHRPQRHPDPPHAHLHQWLSSLRLPVRRLVLDLSHPQRNGPRARGTARTSRTGSEPSGPCRAGRGGSGSQSGLEPGERFGAEVPAGGRSGRPTAGRGRWPPCDRLPRRRRGPRRQGLCPGCPGRARASGSAG